MGPKLSLGVFTMLECIVTFSYDKYLKLSELFRTEVTEINDTKSRAKFPLVAFSLVFKGISRLFGAKWGYYLRRVLAIVRAGVAKIS